MKLIKRSVAVFLAVLMAFSSFALLSSAEGSAIYNWELDTKFYRQARNAKGEIIEGSWVETENAMKGEKLKARVFMKTDFALDSSQFFFFYPTAFLTHDTSEYGTSSGEFVLATNKDTSTKVGANNFGGLLATGTDISGQFQNMIDEGYLTEADITGKGWVMVALKSATESIILDGTEKEWLFEFNFTVNQDATEEGQFYLSTECIADWDNFMAATVIAANIDGDGGEWGNYEASCDVDLGTFGYTLKDTDSDSSVDLYSSLKFDTADGAFEDGTTEFTVPTYEVQATTPIADFPGAPVREGYTFKGWVDKKLYEDEAYTEDDIIKDEYVLKGNFNYQHDEVELIALYEAPNYVTVNVHYYDVVNQEDVVDSTNTYGTNTGNYVEIIADENVPEEIPKTSTYIKFSELPVIEHYKFDSANASNVLTVEAAEAEGKSALDVYYVPESYTVTFDPANGDEVTTSDPITYYTEITAPAAPAKSGMKFTNWLGDDGTPLAAGAKFNLAGNVTYTAQYESAETTVAVKVRYIDPYKPSSTAEQFVDVKTVTTIVGNTVALVEEAGTDENTAYVLISELPELKFFEYDAENTVTTVTATEDGKAELIVNYKPKIFTVVFEGAETFTEPYGTSYTVPEGPVVPGKTFQYWVTEIEGVGEIVQEPGNSLSVNNNFTFTPVYEDIYYNTTVTFNGEEGVNYPEDAVAPTVASGKMGEEIVLNDPVPVTGWEFLGWDAPEGAVEKDGKYYYGTTDVTVTGNWEHTEYTITFWLDASKTIYYDSYNYFYGEVVEFPDAPPADLMPAGQKFVEWDSDIITMPAENVDVIAASENIIYTVSVKTLPDEEPYTFDANYGDVITSDDLAEFEEQEGYTFNGWKINGKDMTAPFEYKVVGNTSVVANLTVNTWDLYFWANADDAEPIAKYEDIEFGAAIHTYTPVAPTKEGHKFRFWDMEPITMEDNDMHFTAIWKTEEYTVIWDNDGTIVEQQQAVKYGSSLEIPEVSKTGYIFKGWAGLAADATTMPDAGNDGETVTYTAVWEANTYDAVFYLDEEKTEVYETVPTKFDADIIAPADPTKSGYDFAGWAPAVGKMDDVNGKEFVATWTAKGDTPYTVNVYTMGTDGEYGAADVKNLTAATDSLVTYTPEIAEGFELNANSKTEGTVTADGNLVLNIWIDRKTFTLTTVVDGVTETKDYRYGAAVAVTTPVKEGHSFAWDAAVPATMPANDVTLNGTFTALQFDLIYMVDGEVYTSKKVTFGDEVTVIDPLTKEGYNFSGWDKTGTFEMPAETVTISGTFAINSYKVIYKVDGNVVYEAEAEYNSKVDLYDYTPEEGYNFSGWDKEDGFTMPAEDVTVNGTTSLITVTITYEFRGDVPADYPEPAPVTATYGENIRKYNNYDGADLVTGYVSTCTGLRGEVFDEATGQHYVGTEDITIIYTWNRVPVRITTNYTGDVPAGYESTEDWSKSYNDSFTLTTPTEEGYTFKGWTVEGAAEYDAATGDVKVGTAAITITGAWEINKHDVIYYVDGVEYARVEDVAYGTPVTVLDDLVEAGKDFSGWDKADFTMPDEDVIINGSWTINNFTVTFYTDKEMTDVKFTYTGAYGAEYNVPAIEKEGYEFLGWFNADGTAANLPDAGAIANVPLNGAVYYADWKVKEFELVYNAGSGKFADGKNTVTFNTEFGTAQADWAKPDNDPTRDGYTFGGWNISDDATMPAAKNVITANWIEETYIVIFKDSLSNEIYSEGNYKFDAEIAIPEPEKAGYEFLYWTDADGNEVDPMTYMEDIGADGATVTYIAKWEGREDVVYTVYRYFENLEKTGWMDGAEAEALTGKAASTALTGKAGTDAEVDAVAEAVEGFTIDTDISVLKKEIAGDGTTILEIYYRRDIVKVTVKDPEGETYIDDEFTFGEEITLDDPEKEGFTFVEWQDADGNKVTFPTTAPADNIVIKPIWSTNTYTITFEDDNGDIIEAAKEVEFGSAIVAPADPEKDGYNFAYWVDKDTGAVMPATMPAKNATYVAYYTAGDDTTYYIEVYTMDVNGEYTMTAQTVATGTTGERIAVNPGELNGYTYDASRSVLTGIITADGKAALKIYYARDLYTVTFKSGDGVFADDATVVGPTNVFYGAAIPVPAEPTREGYDFAGWDAEVPAGMPAENLTFTATWTEAEYTITYIENDKKTVKTYKFGEAVEKPADPEVAGMTFTGWDTEIPETMPAEDLIIIAVFEISVYEVKYIADGVVFQQYAVAHGDEIPVPTEEPTKKFYKFVGWTDIPETMPAQNIEINAIFERVDVKLVPMAGSTTVIDDEAMAIYGLQLYATEEILRESYLDVEGDGYFTVTPSKKTMCGTGTVVELYDNVTGELLETYTIVIFGDLNGDSNINNSDYSIAQAEVDWFTAWSDPSSNEYNVYKTMAADFDKDGMIGRNEAASINREVLGAISIDQTSGNVIAVV